MVVVVTTDSEADERLEVLLVPSEFTDALEIVGLVTAPLDVAEVCVNTVPTGALTLCTEVDTDWALPEVISDIKTAVNTMRALSMRIVVGRTNEGSWTLN